MPSSGFSSPSAASSVPPIFSSLGFGSVQEAISSLPFVLSGSAGSGMIGGASASSASASSAISAVSQASLGGVDISSLLSLMGDGSPGTPDLSSLLATLSGTEGYGISFSDVAQLMQNFAPSHIPSNFLRTSSPVVFFFFLFQLDFLFI